MFDCLGIGGNFLVIGNQHTRPACQLVLFTKGKKHIRKIQYSTVSHVISAFKWKLGQGLGIKGLAESSRETTFWVS